MEWGNATIASMCAYKMKDCEASPFEPCIYNALGSPVAFTAFYEGRVTGEPSDQYKQRLFAEYRMCNHLSWQRGQGDNASPISAECTRSPQTFLHQAINMKP